MTDERRVVVGAKDGVRVVALLLNQRVRRRRELRVVDYAGGLSVRGWMTDERRVVVGAKDGVRVVALLLNQRVRSSESRVFVALGRVVIMPGLVEGWIRPPPEDHVGYTVRERSDLGQNFPLISKCRVLDGGSAGRQSAVEVGVLHGL